ncbi:MAG: hypothetical protein MZV64_00965 [Ignavibacteriales bacterium]|nr:hypothetical protein [Ignavibacteriales bacterium]
MNLLSIFILIRSAARFEIIIINPAIKLQAITSGKSLFNIALTVSLPIPGKEKITSVSNAPPSKIPNSIPAIEIKG